MPSLYIRRVNAYSDLRHDADMTRITSEISFLGFASPKTPLTHTHTTEGPNRNTSNTTTDSEFDPPMLTISTFSTLKKHYSKTKNKSNNMKLSFATVIFTTLSFDSTALAAKVAQPNLMAEIQDRRQAAGQRGLRKNKRKKNTRSTANGAHFSEYAIGGGVSQQNHHGKKTKPKQTRKPHHPVRPENSHFQTHIVGGDQVDVGQYPYFGKSLKWTFTLLPHSTHSPSSQ